MLLRELTQMVHENAVQHGWWDSDRNYAEIIALIHSEWSEALEEARAGRPLVYKVWDAEKGEYITPEDEKYAGFRSKPEGVAVELIDGCIRILDLFGQYEVGFTEQDDAPCSLETVCAQIPDEDVPDELSMLVSELHGCTSLAYLGDEKDEQTWQLLLTAVCWAVKWIKRHGADPIRLMIEKHEYNRKRPYKHGKLF